MNYLRDQKGIGIIMVLLMIIVGGIFTSLLINRTIFNVKTTGKFAREKQAFYAADAGIEYAKYLIVAEDNPVGDYHKNLDAGLSFDLSIEKEDDKLVASSKGFSRSKLVNKEIEATFEVDEDNSNRFGNLNKGLVGNNNITLKGNGYIKRDSGDSILSNENIVLNDNAAEIDGDITVGALGEIQDKHHKISESQIDKNFPGFNPIMFDWDKLRASTELINPEIVDKKGNNRGLNLPVSSKGLYYVNAEDFPNKINYIKGEGILFIDKPTGSNNFTLDFSGNIDIGDSSSEGDEYSHLLIVINGNMKINGNSNHYATYLTMGDFISNGNTKLVGNIISNGQIDITGNSDIILKKYDLRGKEEIIEKYYNREGDSGSSFQMISWDEK